MTTKTKADRNKAMAKRIRAAIEASGKSMREWATLAGIPQQTLSSTLTGLETGSRRSLTLHTLEKVATAMGCTVAELLDEPDPTPPVEPWPEFEAVLMYHPDRWHPDTIEAFRKLRAYKGKQFSPREIEKDLDALDKVVRQFLEDRERATRQSRKK